MRNRQKSVSMQYSVDLTMKGFSFGIGPRSSLLSLQGRDSPSPFKYKPTFSESPYKGVKLKGYSSDLHIIKRLQNLPGPGSYSPYEPIVKPSQKQFRRTPERFKNSPISTNIRQRVCSKAEIFLPKIQ